MPRYRVTIVGRDYDAMADLVRVHRIEVVRQTAAPLRRGSYSVQAFAEPAQIRALQAAGYQVETHEDVETQGRHRQAEARAARTTRGPAESAGGRYLEVDEVEAALARAAAAPNAAFTELIALPHKTWEGRSCHAIRIGQGAGAERGRIYLLGGVHAREWGSPDILVHFVDQVTGAYRANAGLKLGNKQFSAAQIQALVKGRNVYVFPQANPDGRHYSMAVDAWWRKNRRPPADGAPAHCVGVDINRNYDFLWDYTKHFDSRAPVACSKQPCDDVYIGPGALSEPETKNVVWLLERDRQIRYFVDVHSYGELILHSWGDDQNQSTNPRMNFRNAAYDGRRGRADDATYREYVRPSDRKAAVAIAGRMRAAIKAVRGRTYKVQQSMALYPTAGTADDYFFSRHLVDPGAPKVRGFTIEWGSAANATPFHPAYGEMAQIIPEVTAGLIEFCRYADH